MPPWSSIRCVLSTWMIITFQSLIAKLPLTSWYWHTRSPKFCNISILALVSLVRVLRYETQIKQGKFSLFPAKELRIPLKAFVLPVPTGKRIKVVLHTELNCRSARDGMKIIMIGAGLWIIIKNFIFWISRSLSNTSLNNVKNTLCFWKPYDYRWSGDRALLTVLCCGFNTFWLP